MAKLLVVEDHAKIRDIMRRHLALKGFEVVLAADGEAGVASSEVPSACRGGEAPGLAKRIAKNLFRVSRDWA